MPQPFQPVPTPSGPLGLLRLPVGLLNLPLWSPGLQSLTLAWKIPWMEKPVGYSQW